MEEVSDISPQDFFTRFVSPRKPCKLSGNLLQCDEMMKWRNFEYLKEKCGKYNVRVEKRCSTKETYGNGNETVMLFEDFLNLVKDENEKVYITTQELLYSEEGMPSLYSPPIDGVLKDFHMTPKLLGNLIPQNFNLWMGYTSPGNPSSSRLHHDFHDNLYVLLKGEKQIVLYHYDYAPYMYTVGSIQKVHENGRINYLGQRPTNADGSDISSNAAYLASLKLDIALKKLEALDDMYDEIDDEIDKALEDVLDAEIADNDFWDDDDSEDVDYGIDDKNISPDYTSCNLFNGSNSDNLKRKLSDSNFNSSTHKIPNNKSDPNNFSQVDLTLSVEKIKENFPLFYSIMDKKIEISLKEGEGLFIPAGWFHEVKSSGTHMAFNYWLHPCCSGVKYCCYETPYGDNDFWLHDWLKRFE